MAYLQIVRNASFLFVKAIAMIKKIRFNVIDKLLKRINLLPPGEYLSMLRYYGIVVGEDTYISPDAVVDITRPSLVTIGRKCYLNLGFKLLTHDWVAGVMRHVYGEFLNSSGRVTIGNNVGTGYNVTILKGVTIGDNVFIAANSLVTKDVPSNCVIGGQPAKVMCTLDDYRQKRLAQCESEALDYARSIRERFHREPRVEDFYEEFSLFVDGNNEKDYPNLPVAKQLGDEYLCWKRFHKRKYIDFEAFLKASYNTTYEN